MYSEDEPLKEGYENDSWASNPNAGPNYALAGVFAMSAIVTVGLGWTFLHWLGWF